VGQRLLLGKRNKKRELISLIPVETRAEISNSAHFQLLKGHYHQKTI
jgi:hypothetical protein